MDEKLLAEIVKLRPGRRPVGFGITAREYGKARGVSRCTASRMLKELTEQGILTENKMFEDGRWTLVFTKAKA
jgi:DNA-binding transcriptional ArsR family regulator